MRIRRLIAASAAAAVLLSGCTSLSLNSHDILAPPRAAGSRAEIQSMMEKDSGGIYSLIYPVSGDYKSGVVQYDLDHDGVNEVISMYTAADGTARVMAAVSSGGSYSFLGSEELNSSNIGSLCFADIDADGTDELFVSCDAGTSAASLDAYVISDGGIDRISVAGGFTDYVAGDFDGNSAADALILTPPSVEVSAKAVLMVYSDGAFSEKSSCEADQNVVACRKLTFGSISENVPGAAVDGLLSGGGYSTQIFYYDASAHSLLNPLLVYSGYEDTVRASAICSADIDGDGVTEVPVFGHEKHPSGPNGEEACEIAHWSSYSPTALSPQLKLDTILCERMGFMFRLTPGQASDTAAIYTADNAVTLYSLTYRNSEPELGGALLTIKRYDKDSFDSSMTAEADLYESNAYIYTYILSEGSSYTHDEVKNSFMLINQ